MTSRAFRVLPKGFARRAGVDRGEMTGLAMAAVAPFGNGDRVVVMFGMNDVVSAEDAVREKLFNRPTGE